MPHLKGVWEASLSPPQFEDLPSGGVEAVQGGEAGALQQVQHLGQVQGGQLPHPPQLLHSGGEEHQGAEGGAGQPGGAQGGLQAPHGGRDGGGGGQEEERPHTQALGGRGAGGRGSVKGGGTIVSTHCHCCNFQVSLQLAHILYQGQKFLVGARRRSA